MDALTHIDYISMIYSATLQLRIICNDKLHLRSIPSVDDNSGIDCATWSQKEKQLYSFWSWYKMTWLNIGYEPRVSSVENYFTDCTNIFVDIFRWFLLSNKSKYANLQTV